MFTMKVDGKQIASKVLEDLKTRVKILREKKVVPHLAIILIGDDTASKIYIKQKIITAEKIGIKTSLFQYTNSISAKELLERLNDLNHLSSVHGIIIQRPIPTVINAEKLNKAINPEKDVDGFHPKSKFQPPIALAVIKILEELFVAPRMVARQRPRLLRGEFQNWLKSKKIVVVGKGETGGKPVTEMFKKMHIQPEIIDTKILNVENITKKADIIISAVGKPNIVKPDMIKKGVILISIGLHKGTDGRLHGDYDEERIKHKASFYTPTPGGVGPVNVAMLLQNLIIATESLS